MTTQEQAARNIIENANNPASYTARLLDYLTARVVTFQRVARFGMALFVIGIVVGFSDIFLTHGNVNGWWLLGALLAGIGGALWWGGYGDAKRWRKMAGPSVWVELRMDVKAGTLKTTPR